MGFTVSSDGGNHRRCRQRQFLSSTSSIGFDWVQDGTSSKSIVQLSFGFVFGRDNFIILSSVVTYLLLQCWNRSGIVIGINNARIGKDLR